MGNKILSVDEFVPPKYKAQFLRFLADHWDEICQAAVSQYAKQGRSVLTFTMGDRGIQMMGVPQKRAIAFFDKVLLTGEELDQDSMQVMFKIMQFIKTYDPNTEMVLWFSFPGDDEFYCKVEMKLWSESFQPDLN